MTISHLLEDFGGRAETADNSLRFMTEDELEDVRLGAFEQGYSAGWEDATTAQAKDHKRISTELASSLEDLSFTYHEASRAMLKTLEPVFATLIEKVLPTALNDLFGQQILSELKEIAANVSDIPAVILVPPGTAPAIEAMIPPDLGMPVRVLEDVALKDGQAGIKLGAEEREIDTTGLCDAFGDAVAAFFHQINKEAKNG